MSDDNIIPFVAAKAGELDPRRVFRRKRDFTKPHCRHQYFEVSMDEADLSCADCGADLDPWSVLRDLASKYESFWNSMEVEKSDRDKLRREIEALKKERSKLRRGLPREVTAKIEWDAQIKRQP